MNLWQLPTQAVIGGRAYAIATDFREVLAMLSYLADDSRPVWLRWQVALRLFYGEPVPPEHTGEAMAYLSEFVRCGEADTPGPRRFDWVQDAAAIISDVNRVAGREIRAEGLHWWTFLSFFRAIGEGQLSALVAIREKLRLGKPLDEWEQAYFRENRDRVLLRRPPTAQEEKEKQRLLALLE